MKKIYEKPAAEFLSFRLRDMVAVEGESAFYGGGDEQPGDPGYQFGDDGPGL